MAIDGIFTCYTLPEGPPIEPEKFLILQLL